ncbi:hypothetical protein L484_000798 [Morus notabilis]|uniref:Uncharacterized protein n=1 Tax=Morus notabilis TaxID=981085 RepID=W9QYT2_9ROSA|nr:hypothetical protein L484_002136 [Morus notabilis]EXB54985.1 hypothetical protein L484_000798 [Morus notabilis]
MRDGHRLMIIAETSPTGSELVVSFQSVSLRGHKPHPKSPFSVDFSAAERLETRVGMEESKDG